MTFLRRGRLSNYERELILIELGELTRQRYDEYLERNNRGYNLNLLKGSLQFIPMPNAFENEYYLNASDEELTKLAYYFEYGTGLFNTKTRIKANLDYIRSKSGKLLRFQDKKGKLIFTPKVKGVRPVFAMTKAIKSIDQQRDVLQRGIRIRLGI